MQIFYQIRANSFPIYLFLSLSRCIPLPCKSFIAIILLNARWWRRRTPFVLCILLFLDSFLRIIIIILSIYYYRIWFIEVVEATRHTRTFGSFRSHICSLRTLSAMKKKYMCINKRWVTTKRELYTRYNAQTISNRRTSLIWITTTRISTTCAKER